MTDYSQIPDCFYRVSIKALILDENGRFLLSREDNGKWDFPGGGYEFDDKNPQEALAREIREEMGLEVTSVADIPSYFVTVHKKERFYFANVFYKTTVKDLNITPSDECEEAQFFTVEEALQKELFNNVIAFCKQYKN
jgi:8-oxo-dGTP pyrophosphatase MutT (NUDIX family)